MTISFYTVDCEYGVFSNFSPHGFELDGAYWPTAEHYFQAQKFLGHEQATLIRESKKPGDAKRLGQTRQVPLRPDWENVKDEVMRKAVMAKFQTHEDIRAILLGTAEEDLVENAPSDYYWGCGATGTGKNRLGQILMEVRTSLRLAEKKAK